MSDLSKHFLPGLNIAPYVTDPLHTAIATGADQAMGPDIGKDGQNLTLTFLSYNRSGLSLRLLRSMVQHVPHFKGEILIADNGSDREELIALKMACAAMPLRIRILELGQNYGVAGGRNRAIAEITTDWVASLDNDIFFVGDPLAAIQADIAALGCHFLNLPLLQPDQKTLFSLGGHLYLSALEDGLHLGGGPACSGALDGATTQPFLSTFLFGGASVFNRHSFQRLGGFDTGMFIGFEDTEFSLRVFREGMKIGNTQVRALVHDHPPPQNGADLDYERRRFATEALEASAKYFHQKHGIHAWSDSVAQWLKSRHDELGLHPEQATSLQTRAVDERPTIALVLDTEGWAFANIAGQLKKHLSHKYRFDIVAMDQFDNALQLLLATAHADLTHFFWRPQLGLLVPQTLQAFAQPLTLAPDRLAQDLLRGRTFSTAVYDHLFLQPEEVQALRPLFEGIAGYYTCSRKLDAIYRNLPGYPRPSHVLEDGVDTQRFRPLHPHKYTDVLRRPLVVGWTGNSKWAAEREDFKGVHTLLQPAIEDLQREGFDVVPHFADRVVRAVPHAEMPRYYSEIDVYVCPSKIEGTPNPVLEAMACGVPVISTDVGIVPDALGPQQRQFILRERSIECLKDALKRLMRDPGLFQTLSEENLHRVQAWDWKLKAEAFSEFFDQCLESSRRSQPTAA